MWFFAAVRFVVGGVLFVCFLCVFFLTGVPVLFLFFYVGGGGGGWGGVASVRGHSVGEGASPMMPCVFQLCHECVHLF